ncbi:anti-sigma factor [Bacillus sp. Marseille-P3661]|uniref:anti-sigma factor n=1 Tax=Bacillus sp. Marseille-P3661 TaxID=1936234 RepID=UPI000C8464F1|nr:anti-sigma factor [Bacillus sp. Marseille-P3661]
MTCNSQVHEESIIGLVRGELHKAQEHSLRNHMEQCQHCKEVFDSWLTIFNGLAEKQRPSAHTKKRIMKSIRKERSSIRFTKPTFIFMSTCFAMVMMLIGYIIKPTDLQTPPQVASYTTNQSLKEPFMVKDDTDVYEISPEWNDRVSGYAWINPYSNEMMLLVDGLHPISLNDYQAWIQTADELINVGLLKVNGQKGQLYIQDGVVHQLEHIMVSKEPLGGSDVPTDPNPFLIKINSN